MKNGLLGVVSILLSVFFLQSTHAKTIETVPGEIIVQIRENREGPTAQATAIYTLERTLGSDSVLDMEPFETDESMNRIRMANEDELLNAMAALEENPHIEFVEPNYIYRHYATPNDPQLDSLWGLKNKGQKDGRDIAGIAGVDINVFPAWKAGFTGDKDMIIAVIDTGVAWDHPDLVDNLFVNKGEIPENGKDDDNNGFIDDVHGFDFTENDYTSEDDHLHGTHCAGTIAAKGNNEKGVVGVNWNAKILPLKFMTKKGFGNSKAAVNSINYARMMGAKIMSNSWGGPAYSVAVKKAIEKARDEGILFVAAAGNGGQDREGDNNDFKGDYPASYDVDNILSVAAIQNNGKLGTFSNYGKKTVDIAAPGVSIVSTVLEGKYKAYSGTSMAAPHAAGAAALLWSAKPDLDYAEVKDQLMRSSKKSEKLRNRVASGGFVDVWRAIQGKDADALPQPKADSWRKIEEVIESKHDYDNNQTVTFEFKHEGAKFIRFHFEKIKVENRYDTIEVQDADGNILDEITGTKEDAYSEYVSGEYAKIVLKADRLKNFYGFKVDFVEVQ